MKLLVTGADGLLGSNLVPILLARGHSVTAMLQPGRQPRTLADLTVTYRSADLLNREAVEAAHLGMEAVIHCAASTRLWPPRHPSIRAINFQGTRNVVEAAMTAGIKRFIHVGTANSFAPGTRETPGDETGAYTGAHYGLDYMDSKYAAQEFVLERFRQYGFPVLVVNPTFLIGPFDRAPGSGRMLLALHAGKIRGYPPGGRNFVHARDAASAIANALELGECGDCHILGNVNLPYGEAFRLFAGILNVSPPVIPIPCWLNRSAGWVGSLVGSLTGQEPLVSREMTRIACDDHYYSAARAVQRLEMPQTPIAEAVQESWEWLEANGRGQDNE